MRTPCHLAAVVAALTVSALAVSEAQAYVRTKTCDPLGRTRPCAPGQQALPVFWPDPCLTYYVHRAGSDDHSPGADLSDEVREAILDSFGAWNAPSCAAVTMQMAGLTCNGFAGKREHPQVSGKQHVVMWREDDDWILDDQTLAVTLVNARPGTGEIMDADIEMNGVDWTWQNLDGPTDRADVADIRNVLTHEVGHFLGLDHELSIVQATMFVDAPSGEVSKRDLHPDDINGLCEMYPFTGRGCSKRFVVDESCTEISHGEPGCSAGAPSGGAPLGPWALVWVLGCGVGRRLRRGAGALTSCAAARSPRPR